VSSFDLCQNQVSAPLSQRPPLEHLFILVQRKRIWEAPSSLLANNPTVDAIQNIIKQIPAHKNRSKISFANAINCAGAETRYNNDEVSFTLIYYLSTSKKARNTDSTTLYK
jgi:hypothetical protein